MSRCCLAGRFGVLVVILASLLAGASAAAAAPPSFAPGPDGELKPFGGTTTQVHGRACVADFDGDGNNDVAAPAAAPSGIFVGRGDGTGHVTTPYTAVVTTTGVAGCAAGDLNGDARADLVVADAVANSIVVALGQANGTFTQTPVATGLTGGVSAVAIGDTNADGKPDIAAGSISSAAQNSTSVLLGDGTGQFSPAPGAPAFPYSGIGNAEQSNEVFMVDMTGDGRTDVVTNASDGDIYVATANTDGSINSATARGAGVAFAITLGDFDGDGLTDVVSTQANRIAYRRGVGGGNLDPGVTLPTPPDPAVTAQVRAISAGDVNGDGKLDVILGEGDGSPNAGLSRLWVFPGTGNAVTPLPQSPVGPFLDDSVTERTHAGAAIADMNNDGRLDIVANTALAPSLAGVMLNTTPVPGVVTGEPVSTGDTVATVSAKVTPVSSAEYGVELISAGGSVDRRPTVGSVNGGGTETVQIPISGLSPTTTYRYRAYATNPEGTTVSPVIKTFTTGILRPASTSPPGISGVAQPGSTLTCSPGSFSGDPTSIAFQWLRGGGALPGETSSTHVVTTNDVGSALSCRVTATNAGGSASADTATIVATPVVVPTPKPTNVAAPRLAGTAAFGQLLACDAGSWTTGGTFTYQWLSDGNAIAGATGAGYRIAKKDIAKQLRCRVTLTNAGGATSVTSSAKTVVRPPCVVPDVKGKTVKDARKAIVAGGCAAGRTVRGKGTGVAKGRVLSTRPKAGTKAKGGTKVVLVVRGT